MPRRLASGLAMRSFGFKPLEPWLAVRQEVGAAEASRSSRLAKVCAENKALSWTDQVIVAADKPVWHSSGHVDWIPRHYRVASFATCR
jgi:hypothetical protein